MRPFPLVLPMLVGLLHASAPSAVEPVGLGTLEHGEIALPIADPSIGPATPALTALAMPPNAAARRVAFASARNDVVSADVLLPTLSRVPFGAPATTTEAGT